MNPPRRVPRPYPRRPDKGAQRAPQRAGHRCGDAINLPLTKSLEVVKRRGANLLYVSAAGPNEISYATSQGSLATQAWTACIADPTTDKDHSGTVSGQELQACAQARIN